MIQWYKNDLTLFCWRCVCLLEKFKVEFLLAIGECNWLLVLFRSVFNFDSWVKHWMTLQILHFCKVNKHYWETNSWQHFLKFYNEQMPWKVETTAETLLDDSDPILRCPLPCFVFLGFRFCSHLLRIIQLSGEQQVSVILQEEHENLWEAADVIVTMWKPDRVKLTGSNFSSSSGLRTLVSLSSSSSLLWSSDCSA